MSVNQMRSVELLVQNEPTLEFRDPVLWGQCYEEENPSPIVPVDSEDLMTMGLKPIRIYYGWLVVAASSGIGFAKAATAIEILTILVIPMSQEFAWSQTEMSGATSLGAILGAALTPFSGRLVDRRDSRAVLTLGGLTVVLAWGYLASGIVYDRTETYQQAFSYFALLSLVSSALILAARPPNQPELP